MQRVEIERIIPASADAVRSALLELAPGMVADGELHWTEPTPVVDSLAVHAEVHDANGTTTVRLAGGYEGHVPYFNWLFGPLIRSGVRKHLHRTADAVGAALRGDPPPPRARAPVWAPPAAMRRDQVRAVATICFVLALTGYGGSLLTHAIDHIAQSYEATNAQLGVLTAFTRVGTLVAIVGTALADRLGRRRILLWSIAALSLFTFLSAFSPGLAPFGVLQVLVRGTATLAGVVAFIAAVEEAPERARAWTLAIAGIAGSLGFALGAILLPIADLHSEAWRVLFVLGGAGLVFLPGISRQLLESRRFLEATARHLPRGRPSIVAHRGFGGRFLVVALTGFLLNVFVAPSSQFLNRYLIDERGFSSTGVLGLRATTQTITALIAVWAGGRLAESWGRRPAARWGVLVMSIMAFAFFTADGVVLWLTLMLWSAGGAFASPALSAFNTELFPTQARGTAGAGLVGTAVLGSVAGLLIAGQLAEPLDSIGTAIALLAAGPLLVTLLIGLLPEARGLDLDEVSPPEE